MERDNQDIVTPENMDQYVIHGSEISKLNNVKTDPNALRVSTSPDIMETPTLKPAEVTFSVGEKENQDAQNQLVLYDPAIADAKAASTIPASTEVKPLCDRKRYLPNYASRAFPDRGTFAVQCDRCFKWQYIHTKEKYEEIREHISEHPFYCELTHEWNANKSCSDPPDLTQDGSRLWAIDQPNIIRPPPGWEWLLKIRKGGGTKFADVYYDSPSGMRLRSKKEVEKYLEHHPEYKAQRVLLKMFSFNIPRPLQEDYVKKRLLENNYAAEAFAVNPISWAPPNGSTDFLGGLVPSAPSDEASLHVPDGYSPKKP